MRTILGRLLLPGGVLAAMLLLLVAVPAAAQGNCSLTVTPRNGPPGTQFKFTGTGFTSTSMTLTRQGEEPRTLPLTNADTDPFTVKLIGGDGDVGRWHAVAEGCRNGATFRVTLPPTATQGVPSGTTEDRTPAVAAFGLLAVLFVGASTMLLPRVARSLRSR
jgi:hypothetical protein